MKTITGFLNRILDGISNPKLRIPLMILAPCLALVLAVLMPLVSWGLTGMPTAGKMVCMMAELATVATVFGALSRRWKALPAVLVAVLAAKGVYYALKAVVLAPAVLVGTEWWMQLGAVALWSGLFAMLYKRSERE